MENRIFLSENETSSDRKTALDDMILTTGEKTTAGSKMLAGYSSLFEAEAVTRLKNAGFSIYGKTNVGEFGMDLLGETSAFGAVTDENGNLSLAAAEAVKIGAVTSVICCDNNGAPRRGASVAGLKYLKPTYGMVSRYGIIPTACSSEGIGILSSETGEIAGLLEIIAGHDTKDGTTYPTERYSFTENDVKGMKIAILSDYTDTCDDTVAENIRKMTDALKSKGAAVTETQLGLEKEAHIAWHIAFCAETCNNLSRYDGVKFGYRTAKYNDIEDLYTGSRSESFSLYTKSVILYGSDVLSKGRYDSCYDKALKMRRILRNRLTELFSEYDAFLLPACDRTSYTKESAGDSIDAVFREERYTAVSSLTGIPCAVSGGVQILADSFRENTLLGIMEVSR